MVVPVIVVVAVSDREAWGWVCPVTDRLVLVLDDLKYGCWLSEPVALQWPV
jgi:hypothetical protein